MTDLGNYLKQKQALVDEHLRRHLERLADSCPASLLEAMRYSLLAPGKRLRPILTLMAAQAAGGTEAQALPAGCAVEMIHTYSLVHDDLPAMDDDDLRRGMPTCHKRFGEALAILAGDALLTYAFGVLAENYPPRTAAASCRELAYAAGAPGMVGGQVDDLAWEKKGGTLDDLIGLHSRKTGALFRVSLKLGVLTAQCEQPAGPDQKLLNALDAFGRCLGLVFQITDDLLDVEGSAEHTGKQVHKDAARGKLTYPGILGVEESRRRARALVEEANSHLREVKDSTLLKALLASIVDRDR